MLNDIRLAPIKAGRAFEPSDRTASPPVVIVSESMARYYLKDQNAIGRHVSWRRLDGTWTPPDALAPRIIETIRQLDPNRPIDHVQTLEEIRDEAIAPQRLNATLIGLFALLALAIATVGVAGVLAFSVSQRTNELGIRLALGAERRSILRMILGEGVAMALVGLMIGGAAAIPLSRYLAGLLFGVEPADPVTLLAAAGLLLMVAIVAAWIPARAATAVDPMSALRAQ